MTIFPPFSALADQVPLPNTPPYHGAPAQSILIPEKQASVPCQPTELFRQANSILLWKPEVTSASCNYRACLSQPLLIYSAPKCNCSVALCGTWLLPPWGWEYRWLITVVSLICLGLSVVCPAVPIIPGWDSDLANTGKRRQSQSQWTLRASLRVSGKESACQAGDTGCISDWEDPTCRGAAKLWMPQLLKPEAVELVHSNKRSHGNKKPTLHN